MWGRSQSHLCKEWLKWVLRFSLRDRNQPERQGASPKSHLWHDQDLCLTSMLTWRCQHSPLGGRHGNGVPNSKSNKTLNSYNCTPVVKCYWGLNSWPGPHRTAPVTGKQAPPYYKGGFNHGLTGLAYYLLYYSFSLFNFLCMIYVLCLNVGQWQV